MVPWRSVTYSRNPGMDARYSLTTVGSSDWKYHAGSVT